MKPTIPLTWTKAIVLMLIGANIAGVAVSLTHNYHWRSEAVERGFAEYNSTTGKWQWRETPLVFDASQATNVIRYRGYYDWNGLTNHAIHFDLSEAIITNSP